MHVLFNIQKKKELISWQVDLVRVDLVAIDLMRIDLVKGYPFAEVDQSLLRGQSVHEHLIDM